jgi:hypothetical protein
MTPGFRGNLRRLAPFALMTIALAFVAYTAWMLYRRWEPGRVEITVWLALLSTPPLVIGVLIQAWAWVRLIRRMSGTTVAMLAGLRLYFDSQLARYAPGKVGLPLVRMEGAARLGVGAPLVGSSILLETLSWAAVGGVTSMLALAASGRQKAAMFALLGRYAVPLMIAFALALLALLVVDRRLLPAFVTRALRLGGEGPLVPPDLPLLHVAHWATWAVHGYLLSRAVGASFEDASAAVAAFLVAPLGGFFIVAAPAGLGVREALLSLALAPSVGSAGALAAAGVSRICTLGAEVACWAALHAMAAGDNHPS